MIVTSPVRCGLFVGRWCITCCCPNPPFDASLGASSSAPRYHVATFDRISRRNWGFRYLAGIRNSTHFTNWAIPCALASRRGLGCTRERESLDAFQAVVTRFTTALQDEHVTRDCSRRLRLGQATLCADLPHTAVLGQVELSALIKVSV